MPQVARTPITDPVTPAKLEVVLKPIRLLQENGKIDKDNFLHETVPSYGILLHSGELIRNIADLVDSAKIFEGRSIYTESNTHESITVPAATLGPVSNLFVHINSGNSEKDFFINEAKVANFLYKPEYTIRDIEYKLSYSRDDIKSSFRTKKDITKELDRVKHRLAEHALTGKALRKAREKRDRLKQELAQYRATGTGDYEFVSLSQSIEVEMPTGYMFDAFEIFGDLDWGWKNEVGEEKMAVGVLYLEFDSSRDDFVVFKFSILFDEDVSLSEDDYVLAAGKVQYRVKRYA